MQVLEGKTCVISGAVGGDGEAIVEALCRAGMNVVMATRKEEQAKQIRNNILQAGLKGNLSYILGAKNQEPIEYQNSTYEKIEKSFGSVDLLICNNGDIGNRDSIETLTPQKLSDSFSHLAVGSFRMLQAALCQLKKSRDARVIFMTSVEGCCGGTQEGFANAVAKGTIRALTVNCAARLQQDHIHVNCIAKGVPDKKIEFFQNQFTYVPSLERLDAEGSLAKMVCYLASEEAKDITGQVFSLEYI